MRTIRAVETSTPRRTTIYIPPDLDARIKREATRRGASYSQVIRDATLEHLDRRETHAGTQTQKDGRLRGRLP